MRKKEVYNVVYEYLETKKDEILLQYNQDIRYNPTDLTKKYMEYMKTKPTNDLYIHAFLEEYFSSLKN